MNRVSTMGPMIALLAACSGDDRRAAVDETTSASTGVSESMDTTDTDPSGDPTTMDDSSSMTVTMTGSETDTDPSETTGPSACQFSADCVNPDNPICVDNDCAPCTDTPDGDVACNAKDETLPVCNDAGQCVQCNDTNMSACGDTTPVCDTDTSTCVACTYHEQCEATACDIASGACIDGVVFHVDGDAGCDDSGPGTAASPFCSIQVGIDAVGAEGVVIVHAGPTYSESLSISDSVVAVLAAGTDRPSVTYPDGDSTLVMTGAGTQLYLEGLRFANNNNAVALSLAEGVAWLDRVEVVSNNSSGAGVEALSGAEVHLRSSIVARNGEDGNPSTFGLHAQGVGTELHLQNVTCVANLGLEASSLTCDASAIVTVRNSIVARTGLDSIGCTDATVSYSSIDTSIVGPGVVLLDTFDTGWFEAFFSNDFSLSMTGETTFADVALVEAGDYPFDIDGEPRPAVGSMDHAGADTP